MLREFYGNVMSMLPEGNLKVARGASRWGSAVPKRSVSSPRREPGQPCVPTFHGMRSTKTVSTGVLIGRVGCRRPEPSLRIPR
jgi:hypothetical protein